jgi:hypothetical protein
MLHDRWGKIAMPDAETAALLRVILDELCAGMSPFDSITRTNVASRLLETVKQGRPSLDDLREAGRDVLRQPPAIWR